MQKLVWPELSLVCPPFYFFQLGGGAGPGGSRLCFLNRIQLFLSKGIKRKRDFVVVKGRIRIREIFFWNVCSGFSSLLFTCCLLYSVQFLYKTQHNDSILDTQYRPLCLFRRCSYVIFNSFKATLQNNLSFTWREKRVSNKKYSLLCWMLTKV